MNITLSSIKHDLQNQLHAAAMTLLTSQWVLPRAATQQSNTQAVEADALPAAQCIGLQWNKPHLPGDLSTNLALLLAKRLACSPRQLAQHLIEQLALPDFCEQVQVAGPGFINFFLTPHCYYDTLFEQMLPAFLQKKWQIGKGQRVHLEFVSANPTGPLHVGHGRGAAYGATFANHLEAIGFEVHREYYVNDAGRQMHILATSVWIRYWEHKQNDTIPFPQQGYQGQYVNAIAQAWDQAQPDFATWHTQPFSLAHLHQKISQSDPHIPATDAIDADKAIDDWVVFVQKILTATHYTQFMHFVRDWIITGIRADLSDLGITYQDWFFESQMLTPFNEKGHFIDHALSLLTEKGYTYEKEGALWFHATQLGDEKDRVLKRQDGRHTYFAADVAYHLHKCKAGYDSVVNVWGADHHGYVPRVQACWKALACHAPLDCILVQFAILYRGKTRLSMSTRSGDFITLRELTKEVGSDAVRFFYVSRKPDQHLDFDLELAKSHSNDNPVYYIQYAHARICQVLRHANEKKAAVMTQLKAAACPEKHALIRSQFMRLTEEKEKALMQHLLQFEEQLIRAALTYQPHHIATYLQSLANSFHQYYGLCPFLVEDSDLCLARLSLLMAIKNVIVRGLCLLGVSAPDRM